MGTRTRTTPRKPRGTVVIAGKPDDGPAFPIDGAGKPENATGDSDSTAGASGSIIDPASAERPDAGSGDNSTGNVDPTTGKRRYKRRAAKAADPLSISEISDWKDIALSTHAMLFGLTHNPLFDIDEIDAEKITRLSSNVARHYENIPGISPKTKDWILFIQGASAIYGPRFAAWRMQKAMSKPARSSPQSPHAPAHVAPAATAPNQPSGASPGVAQRTSPLPPNNFNGASQTPARTQPGIATLDGSDLPLKMN